MQSQNKTGVKVDGMSTTPQPHDLSRRTIVSNRALIPMPDNYPYTKKQTGNLQYFMSIQPVMSEDQIKKVEQLMLSSACSITPQELKLLKEVLLMLKKISSDEKLPLSPEKFAKSMRITIPDNSSIDASILEAMTDFYWHTIFPYAKESKYFKMIFLRTIMRVIVLLGVSEEEIGEWLHLYMFVDEFDKTKKE